MQELSNRHCTVNRDLGVHHSVGIEEYAGNKMFCYLWTSDESGALMIGEDMVVADQCALDLSTAMTAQAGYLEVFFSRTIPMLLPQAGAESPASDAANVPDQHRLQLLARTQTLQLVRPRPHLVLYTCIDPSLNHNNQTVRRRRSRWHAFQDQLISLKTSSSSTSKTTDAQTCPGMYSSSCRSSSLRSTIKHIVLGF